MRDIIFQELRECNRVISQVTDAKERENGNKILIDIVEKMCELANAGRRGGLIVLEEAAYELEDNLHGKYLKSMLLLIVDGTNPKLVEEIYTAKYFSANLIGYEALHYLVMMFGGLAIQAGEHPRIVEERLLALIPDEVADLYRQKLDESRGNLQKQEGELNLEILEKFYNGGIAATPGDESYIPIKVTDYAIKSLDDRSIQRVLRDFDNSDLAIAMKGLSGEARHRVFDNLSRSLAVKIAEEMECMGPVRMKDVAQAATKIFNTIIKLIKYGEIANVDGEVLCLFAKIFEADEDDAKNQKIGEVESYIYKLMCES